MPDILMDHYEREFLELFNKITEDVKDSDKTGLQNLDAEFKRAKQLLDQMEIEALGMEAGKRPDSLRQVRVRKSELNQLKQKIKLMSSEKDKEFDRSRSLLFGHKGPTDLERGINPNDRLLSDYDHLNSAGESINRTQQMALEAEEIGSSVLIDLRKQREQIERASKNLHETGQDLDRSNRILKDILRRMAANRILSMAIIVLLVATILVVLYYKVFHH